MRIRIDRMYQDNCVLGVLRAGDFKCFTLELPYIDNQLNISSIHPGLYKARKYFSPTFKKWVVLLNDVPDRTWIEIHHGNFTHQIRGCILVGDGIKFIDSDDIPDVTNSVKTLGRLLAILPDEFEVSIQ